MIDRSKMQERRFDFEVRSINPEEGGSEELYVEGYASVFDSPTVLFEYEGIEYKEQICRGAFDNCNMTDVIFNYNHQGKVMARTRNKTLELKVDEKGLFMRDAATNANFTAQIQSVKDMIAQNKIEALQAQVSQLQLAQATSGMLKFPNSWSYGAGPFPPIFGCCGQNNI